MSSGRIWIALFLALLLFHCGGNNVTSPKPVAAPQIVEGPTVSEIFSSSATITWTTDVEATTTLQYGLMSGQYLFRDSSSTGITAHVVRLVGLRSNSNYYCLARSTNRGGVAMTSEFIFKTKMGALDLGPAAWAQYKAGSYSNAISLFQELLALQPQSYEAYCGLGWCYAATPVDSLAEALASFDLAISLKANYTDALAGRGFVNLALKIYAGALADLRSVLELAPNYTFPYNTSINVRDVRVALAEGYYSSQDFASAQIQVNILAPGNGLDPAMPASWVVDGASYASYAEALLAWIEKLRA